MQMQFADAIYDLLRSPRCKKSTQCTPNRRAKRAIMPRKPTTARSNFTIRLSSRLNEQPSSEQPSQAHVEDAPPQMKKVSP